MSHLNLLKEIYHMEDCKKMINVLKQLGHLDGNICTLKGKMASEITSGDEILLTEMIFSTNFNELSLVDMVALLSIVVTENSKEKGEIMSEENQKLVEKILNPSVKYIVGVFNNCGFTEVTEQSYCKNNNFN